MPKKPRLSIITVVLNDRSHIEGTIYSVLSQMFRDYEYIIIDGGSTDGTLDIINKYSDSIRLISEPDNGLYDAMNKGLEYARGEYVYFLNSGDRIYSADLFERVFSLPEADVYYGDVLVVDEDGNEKGLRRLRPPENLTWKDLRRGMLVSHQAFVARREICPKFDLSYRYSADYDWMIRVLKNARTIVNTKMIFVRYLDNGLTKRNLVKSLKERFNIMAKYYGLVPTLVRHVGFGARLTWFYLRNRWF